MRRIGSRIPRRMRTTGRPARPQRATWRIVLPPYGEPLSDASTPAADVFPHPAGHATRQIESVPDDDDAVSPGEEARGLTHGPMLPPSFATCAVRSLQGVCAMGDGAARTQGRGNEHCFSQFRFRGTESPRTVRTKLDAIGTLCRTGDPQCDQFLVRPRNRSVGHRGTITRDTRIYRLRRQGGEVPHLAETGPIVERTGLFLLRAGQGL
jgi:hypothetical protein